jgi:hypothetical protein
VCCILTSQPYDDRDMAIMVNNVFHQLCTLGGEWHDIRTLAANVGAIPNTNDVAYISEAILVEQQFIERVTTMSSVFCKSCAH